MFFDEPGGGGFGVDVVEIVLFDGADRVSPDADSEGGDQGACDGVPNGVGLAGTF